MALDPWGKHVEQEREEAEKWLARSAEDGLPPARSDLGRRFVGGRGYDGDPVEAVKWCYDAAMWRRRQ